jgi:hypothetical protein
MLLEGIGAENGTGAVDHRSQESFWLRKRSLDSWTAGCAKG